MGLLVEAADGYPTQAYVNGYKSQYSCQCTAALPCREIPESDTNIFIEMRMKHFRVVTIRRDKIRWARADTAVGPYAEDLYT
jgi:hypothetical protein